MLTQLPGLARLPCSRAAPSTAGPLLCSALLLRLPQRVTLQSSRGQGQYPAKCAVTVMLRFVGDRTVTGRH